MRCNPPGSRPLAIAALALVFSACNGNGIPAANGVTSGAPGLPAFLQAPQRGNPAVEPSQRRHSASGKIQHVIIIVQENRIFNNLFYGFPGATTAKFGFDQNGNQDRTAARRARDELGHRPFFDFVLRRLQRHRKHSGNRLPHERLRQRVLRLRPRGGPPARTQNPQYSYVPHSETQPYFDMAKQYVLADKMFASNFDASSFISHQYIISGQAERGELSE